VDIDFQEKHIWFVPIPKEQQLTDDSMPTQNNKKMISFDILSIDIGSTSRGWRSIPGARQYTLPTRPISNLVAKFESWTKDITRTTKPQPIHMVIIGAGAAGIELSMSIHSRWNSVVDNLKITLVHSGDQIVPNESDWCRSKLVSLLEERNIEIVNDCVVQEVLSDQVVVVSSNTNTKTSIPFTHCIWATGAEAHDISHHLGNNRGLQITDDGWICVTPTFQSVSYPYVFAAGDCCHIVSSHQRSPPKAGVYAVRAGPIISHNLISLLLENKNDKLQHYQPQSDFLKLMVCGNGMALGFRFGIPMYGKWVMNLKDSIDNKFMNLFRMKYLVENSDEDKQYDDSDDDEDEPTIEPKLAASILLTEDVSIHDEKLDYNVPWKIIRRMMKDETYQQEVVSECHRHRGVAIEQQQPVLSVNNETS